MNYLRAFFVAVTAAPALAAPAKPARPAPPAPATAAVGFDLDRLKELDNPKLTPVRKAELGLLFMRDEMTSPTPRPGPPYTDPKTHDYVLAQIVEKLGLLRGGRGDAARSLRSRREEREARLSHAVPGPQR